MSTSGAQAGLQRAESNSARPGLSACEPSSPALSAVLAHRGMVGFELRLPEGALWVGPELARWLQREEEALPVDLDQLMQLVHADDRGRVLAGLTQPAEGEVALGRLATADGGWRQLRQTARRAVRSDGASVITGVWQLPEGDSLPAPPTVSDAMRLLAQASHEIRNPLNGVLGLVTLARRIAPVETQQRYLDLALQSGQSLLAVLEHTIDLANVSGGATVLSDEWFDLDRSLCEAMRAVTPVMGWGRFPVVYDFDADGLMEVRADPLRLRQIVTNLVANAVRHTQRGHVGLLAELRRTASGTVRLRLTVEDTGVGIAPERLASLFEPFGNAAEARRHGGHGLGLAIVKGLAEAMGGQIGVTSQVGTGTTIELRFEWPARALASAQAGSPVPVPAGAAGHAWLVYEGPYVPSAECFARRLHRLHWRSSIVQGVDAAIARGAPAPDLMLVAAHSVEAPGAVDRLTAAFPGVRKALCSRLDWTQPVNEEHALGLGWTVELVPLTLGDLQRLTSRR